MRTIAAGFHAEGDDGGMFEEDQLIGDLFSLAQIHETLLQLECLRVRHEPQTPDVKLSHIPT